MKVTRFVSQHALFWLMAGNVLGLWLSILLIFPELNSVAGEFTYGRLVPLHLNFQLYGWTSLPLVAWLFKLYPSSRVSDTEVARGATLAWSLALGIGGISWMLGTSSGKIFLEWKGFSRVLFAFTLLFLWCALAVRFRAGGRNGPGPTLARACGLIVLGLIVPLWYWAASRLVYPAVNPHTSGPTAASLLGSTLAVVLLLLIAGPSLGEARKNGRIAVICWAVFMLEVILFLVIDKGNHTHRSWLQAAILGTLLVWIPLLPLYYRCFRFPSGGRDLVHSFLTWFAVLTATGLISFLPKVLDSWKFTNALVAHSHLAMAGFVTSFNIFLLSALRDEDALALFSPRSIRAWNAATFSFVGLMWAAGVMEATDPGFTILPNPLRTILYSGRALCGVVMFACATLWWRASLVPTRNAGSDNAVYNAPTELPVAA